MMTCTHTGNCPCAQPDPCEMCEGRGRVIKFDWLHAHETGGGMTYVSTERVEEIVCPRCEGEGVEK